LDVIKDPVKVSKLTNIPFELLFFILGKGPWITSLIKELRMTYSDVLQCMNELISKYPASMPSIDQLLHLAIYVVDPHHLAKFEDTVIPPKPELVKIDDLCELFHQLNVT